MNTVSLAQAKAKLSEILNRVESGEEVVVTRHGRPIACISAVRAPKKPVKSLAAFRSTMPRWRKPSAKLLREMRDEGLARQVILRFPTALRTGDARHLALAKNHGATSLLTLDKAMLKAGKLLKLPVTHGIRVY